MSVKRERQAILPKYLPVRIYFSICGELRAVSKHTFQLAIFPPNLAFFASAGVLILFRSKIDKVEEIERGG